MSTTDQERAHRAHEMAKAAEPRRFIVTVKLPKNCNHDPHNKQGGVCPVTGSDCTDTTGEHHSFVYETHRDIDYVRQNWEGSYHITRIEEV
jgi:hypothetical protein